MHPSAAGLSAVTVLFVCTLLILRCLVTSRFGFCRESAEEFRQALEERRGAQPLAIVDSRITADDLARGYIVGNSRLRRRHDAIADPAVARDADLPSEHYVAANLGGAGEPDLRA